MVSEATLTLLTKNPIQSFERNSFVLTISYERVLIPFVYTLRKEKEEKS